MLNYGSSEPRWMDGHEYTEVLYACIARHVLSLLSPTIQIIMAATLLCFCACHVLNYCCTALPCWSPHCGCLQECNTAQSVCKRRKGSAGRWNKTGMI